MNVVVTTVPSAVLNRPPIRYGPGRGKSAFGHRFGDRYRTLRVGVEIRVTAAVAAPAPG